MRRALVVLAVALGATVGRATAQTVVLGVGGQLTGEANGRIRVPVYADLRGAPGEKLGSYTVRLEWDPAVLTWQGVYAGAFAQPVERTDSVYYGVLRVGGLSAAGVDGVFDLFVVDFLIVGNQSSDVTLTVFEVVAAGSFTDLTPLVTVVSGTYCPALGRWGDLDRDGEANSRDALAILSALVGLTLDPGFTLSLGDVDGDGVVNSRDALITLSHAVGIAIAGQRVLLYAPGACGTTGTTGVSILPDTIDLAVGQGIRPILVGSVDGQPAGTAVNWVVGNPEVAVVTAEGRVEGRAAGTTTLTAALGPGITAAVPVVVRARRPVWLVDATRASLAAIQMGTARYPFSTPQQAFPVAGDGDTIRVAPGIHDYLGNDFCTGGGGGGGDGPAPGPIEQCAPYAELSRGVVLMGDTLSDGTRPVLRGNPDAQYAVQLAGAPWLEMRDLVLRGFDSPVYQYQPTRKVLMENVRFELRDGADGVALYYGADTVILRRVEFIGDSVSTSYPFQVEDGSALVVLDRVVIDRTRGGAYIYDVDSLDVRDSFFRIASWEALYVDGSSVGTSVYAARNVFEAMDDQAFQIYDARSVVSEGNTFRVGRYGYQMFEAYGTDYPPRAGSRFISGGDSLYVDGLLETSNYAYGLQVFDFDSILVDSMAVVAPDSGFVMYPGYLYGNTVEVRNSRFQNIGGNPMYLAGRRVTVANSEFTGCRVACGTAYGIQAESYVDTLALLEVTGNTFTRVYEAVDAPTFGDVRRASLTGNVMDAVTYGFLLATDSAVLADNAVTGAAYGLYAQPRSSMPMTILDLQRNRFAASGGYALYAQLARIASVGNWYGGAANSVYLYNYSGTGWPVSMQGDTITADSALGGYAMQVYGDVAGTIYGSRIEGGGYGLYASLTGGTLALDSNVVTGTRSMGLYLTAPAGTAITGQRNNIADNRTYGIYASGAGTFAFNNGRFVLNRDRAVYAASGSVDATDNYWGEGGPSSAGDTVFGAVTIVPYLATDPEGTSVPPLAPSAGMPVADLWLAPIGSFRAGMTRAAVVGPPENVDDRAERAARRAERRAQAEARALELRAAREQRKAARAVLPR
jgi:hypothetical protein